MAPKGKPAPKPAAKGPAKPGEKTPPPPPPAELTEKQIYIYIFCAFFAAGCLIVIFTMLILMLTLEETRGTTDYAFQKLRYELSDTLNRPDLKTSRPMKVAIETERLPKHLEEAEQNFERSKATYRRLIKCNESTADGCTYVPTSRYYFSTGEKTWYDAESYCISRDGHLTSILTEEEQRFITNQISEPYWIGLTDANRDGVWEWADGSRVQKEYWSNGEPSAKRRSSDSDHDCTMVAPLSTKQNWNGEDCFERHKWICKIHGIAD